MHADIWNHCFMVNYWRNYILALIRQCVCVSSQPCPTLGTFMDCSPPGSSVHGILPARILEWVAVPFSRESPGKPGSPALWADLSQIWHHLSHKGSPIRQSTTFHFHLQVFAFCWNHTVLRDGWHWRLKAWTLEPLHLSWNFTSVPWWVTLGASVSSSVQWHNNSTHFTGLWGDRWVKAYKIVKTMPVMRIQQKLAFRLHMYDFFVFKGYDDQQRSSKLDGFPFLVALHVVCMLTCHLCLILLQLHGL